jgi:GT2 family glycosyltransferase
VPIFTHSRLVSTNFTYAIVVCTKNRPLEIQDFQKNLKCQSSKTLKEVIVVEGSNQINDSFVRDLTNENTFGKFKWKLLRTSKGKPTALNVALEYLASREEPYTAVVFLDDDINFDLYEIEKGISYLFENNLCGLSPLVINENDICLLGDSGSSKRATFQKQGQLNSAGENYWIDQCNLQRVWMPTDWLPGGACIYKWEKIEKLRFSPSLENHKLGGYALGDDVDFSVRASNFGQIGCLTTIQVIHSSPKNAERNFLTIVEGRGRWKAFLLRQFPDRISFTKIIMLETTRAIWHTVNHKKYPGAYREIYVFLREFLRHLG